MELWQWVKSWVWSFFIVFNTPGLFWRILIIVSRDESIPCTSQPLSLSNQAPLQIGFKYSVPNILRRSCFSKQRALSCCWYSMLSRSQYDVLHLTHLRTIAAFPLDSSWDLDSTCSYWYAVRLTTISLLRPLICSIDHYHSQEVCYHVVFLCYSWWETCLHSRVPYSSLLSAAQPDSKALYRFLSADEIKKTAMCVWCAFEQRDLPASSRYGLRGEFLWGGLNSSLSPLPPPRPSILAEHKQLAGLCSTLTTCLPQCCSQVTISQGQRLRGIVELRFLCVSLANIMHTSTGNSAHSIAGRKSEAQSELAGKGGRRVSKRTRPRQSSPHQEGLTVYVRMLLVLLPVYSVRRT